MSQLDPLKPIPHEPRDYPKEMHVKGSTKSGRVRLISKVKESGKLAHVHKSHQVAVDKHKLARTKEASKEVVDNAIKDKSVKHLPKQNHRLTQTVGKVLGKEDFQIKQLKKLVAEISDEGRVSSDKFQKLLKTEQGTQALNLWAKKSYNTENIEFLKAMSKFHETTATFDTLLKSEHVSKHLLEKEFIEIVKMHNSIVETFIEENSPHEINVVSFMRQDMQDRFNIDPHRLSHNEYKLEVIKGLSKKFDSAETEVSILLSSGDFVNSEFCKALIEEYGK